jgi:hypothetical protein
MNFESVLPVLIVGYGTMGRLYVRDLANLGLPPEQMTVVDLSEEALAACKHAYPAIQVTRDINIALRRKPGMCLNLVNSPAHYSVFHAAIAGGVRHLFAEKPIVDVQHLSDAERLLNQAHTCTTGYLINFSQAVEKLVSLMQKHDLRITQGRSIWGKDRTKDTRPTAGSVEDEMTHPIQLLLTLVRLNQKIESMSVRSMLDYVTFVNAERQREAHLQDTSFPLEPVSTASASMNLRTNTGNTRLFLQSSFVSFEQERRVELLLSHRLGAPAYKAKLVFDVDGEDRLYYAQMGEKQCETFSYPSNHKLIDQLQAVGLYVSGNKPDPRLVHLPHALEAVRVSSAVLEANQLEGITINP